MKETLVQWLIEKFKDLEVDFKYSVIDYETYKSKQIDLLEQAKEIEKDNIINSYCDGRLSVINREIISAEEYYNNKKNKIE
jgi:hypothetical protein